MGEEQICGADGSTGPVPDITGFLRLSDLKHKSIPER